MDNQNAVGFDQLERAWWEWVNANCPFKTPAARGKWMQSNQFSYDGTTWARHRIEDKSNSGKSIVRRAISFHAADGRVVHNHAGDWPTNRRNDPARNWGLPE